MKVGKRVHFYHSREGYTSTCGTTSPVHELWGTTDIRQVTCKLCLAKLWMDIRWAHYQANPGQATPSDRAITRVLRTLEEGTRKPPARTTPRKQRKKAR